MHGKIMWTYDGDDFLSNCDNRKFGGEQGLTSCCFWKTDGHLMAWPPAVFNSFKQAAL